VAKQGAKRQHRDRFIETARQLGTDEDKAAQFTAALGPPGVTSFLPAVGAKSRHLASILSGASLAWRFHPPAPSAA
jgi:hypothetical protein